MEFQDRVVMITGAGGRIGRPMAAAFAAAGARLLLADANGETLSEAAAVAGRAGAAVFTRALDVTDEEAVSAFVADGEGAIGPIDALVNVHGFAPTSLVLEASVDEWDRVFAVNVRGTMLCGRAVARRMIARGAGGAIVNISSGASTSARAGGAAYCGSKAAVNMLTQVFAIEMGPHGIRVNAVAPGLILDRELRRGEPAPHPYIEDILKATPLGRTGSSEDIANAAMFLASDKARWITGEVLYVTGGSHAGRTHMAIASGMPYRI